MTVNQFTPTNLYQCGDLIVTVAYSSDDDYNALTSAGIYSSANDLTHTFDRTWRLSVEMEFSVSVTIAYAKAPDKG